MRKYRLVIDDGYGNSRHPAKGYEVEIEDGLTDDEIGEIALEVLFEHIGYSFMPDEDGDS